MCALLRVSTGCRRAAQSAVGSCDVSFEKEDINKLAAFSAWLPQHAGLVSSILISSRWGKTWPAAEQLICAALERCLLPGDPISAKSIRSVEAAAAAAAVPFNSRSTKPLLRLSSFSAPWVTTPAIINSIAAAGALTHLSLTMQEQQQPSAAVCAAIGGLHSLQSMDASLAYDTPIKLSTWSKSWQIPQIPHQLSASVHKLQQLTRFVLELPMEPAQAQQLPGSLQHLFAVLKAPSNNPAGPFHVNLRHLTALTCLVLQCSAEVSEDSVLPEGVVDLYVDGACNAVLGKQLTQLELTTPHKCLGLLRRLPRLPTLGRLELAVNDNYTKPSLIETAAVVAAVGTATQLTYFKMRVVESTMMSHTEVVEWGAAVAKLVNLQSLTMDLDGAAEADALKLTALTRLTKLDLNYSGESVSDLVATAWACRLRNLRVLELENCGVHSQAISPVFATLPELESLDLCDGKLHITDAGLLLLSSLTKLTSLRLGNRPDGPSVNAVSNQAVERLIASLPRLRDHDLHSLND